MQVKGGLRNLRRRRNGPGLDAGFLRADRASEGTRPSQSNWALGTGAWERLAQDEGDADDTGQDEMSIENIWLLWDTLASRPSAATAAMVMMTMLQGKGE